MRTRREHDSLGPVEVPEDRLWGAQTQRSLENFPIGRGRFVWGRPVIRAFGLLKKCRGARQHASSASCRPQPPRRSRAPPTR